MACHFEAARKLIDTIVRPITGVALAALMGFPLTSNWLMLSITLYFVSGIYWIPGWPARSSVVGIFVLVVFKPAL
jgi:uncharacterized membrane protein